MKLKLLLQAILLFSLLYTYRAKAQCPTAGQNFTFASQQQINDFGAAYANCTDIILRSVTIGFVSDMLASDIADLTPLQNITGLGAIYIGRNPNLTSRNGLNNLTEIGSSLNISDNAALTTIDGLSSLESIGEHLYINSNAALTAITGLNHLVSIGRYLYISNNTVLTTIDGFNSLTSIGTYLSIQDNSVLTTINGFDNLTSIGTYLNLLNNSLLDDINGFSSLTTIGESLVINNIGLAGLSGLQSLTSIGGNFDLRNNPMLTNLDALNTLTSINGYLAVIENPLLTGISGLQNINPSGIGGGYGLYITDNERLAVCNLPNFCTYLSNPDNPRTIVNNKDNCLDEQAVLDDCSFWQNITPDNDNILYVNSNVPGGSKTGNDWANAILQLADALKWAKEKYNTDNTVFDAVPLKIYVAKGTYKPLYRADNLNGGNPQDRDNAFVMVKNVHIYGGFDPENGIATLEDSRILPGTAPGVAEGSVLSGDFLNDDRTTGSGTTLTLSGNDENAHHILISAGNVGSALVNGFTIKGGNANGGSSSISVNGQTGIQRNQGGGLRNQTSSPQLIHVSFLHNQASTGGGVFNAGNSQPLISQSSFIGNFSTGSGAGFYQNTTSTLHISNNIFSGNKSNSQGGGMFINQNATVEIINSLFIDNRANNNGAGIANWAGGTLRIHNSTLSGNSSGGGVVYNNGTPTTATLVANSIIFGNNTGINGTPDLQYSLVQGRTDTDNGNIAGTADPLFVNPGAGDFGLQAFSPVINVGNNALYTGNIDTDIDLAGNPRLYGLSIDLGAYESQRVLPIQIATFGVTRSDDNALLQWSTLTEDNNNGFYIEYSTDGSNWSDVVFVATQAPQGNSQSILDYNYTDVNPGSGQHFYRLRQIDLDGAFTYSEVRAVAFDSRADITVYPNPVRSSVTISGLGNGTHKLSLINSSGQVINQYKVQSQSQFKMDMSGLASGIYYIQIADEQGGIKSEKIVKW